MQERTVELTPGVGQTLEFVLKKCDRLRQELREVEDTVRLTLAEVAQANGLDPARCSFDREARVLRQLPPETPPANDHQNNQGPAAPVRDPV